jgi:hypothetical protein
MVMLMNDKVFGVRRFYSVLSKEMRRLEAELLRPGPPGFEMTAFRRDMRLIGLTKKRRGNSHFWYVVDKRGGVY